MILTDFCQIMEYDKDTTYDDFFRYMYLYWRGNLVGRYDSRQRRPFMTKLIDLIPFSYLDLQMFEQHFFFQNKIPLSKVTS
jgi:hypothetical protein